MSYCLNQVLIKNDTLKLTDLLIKNDLRYLSSSTCYATKRTDRSIRTEKNEFENLTNIQKLDPNRRKTYYNPISRRYESKDKQLNQQISTSKRLVERLKNLLKSTFGQRLPDDYYFKRDKMDEDDQLIYLDNESRFFRFIAWIAAIGCPIGIYYIVQVYQLKKEVEFLTREDEGDFEIFQMIPLIFGYIIYLSVILGYLTRITRRIYFNANRRKFTIILNQVPFIRTIRKREIDSGQVLNDPSKYSFLKLFKPDLKLPNGQRIYVKDHLFITPFYSNLFYGYTKDKKSGFKI